MKYLGMVCILILLLITCISIDPPLLADQFMVSFNQEWKVNKTSYIVNGQWYYDSTNNRQRVDRINGRYDLFCGTVLPNTTTQCQHITKDNKRFIIFPLKSICCFCCDSSHGCGILRKDWLINATYQGQKPIGDSVYDMWSKDGLGYNYMYVTTDQSHKPRLLDQNGDHLTDYLLHSYVQKELPDSIFQLPSYCSSAQQCPSSSFCGKLRQASVMEKEYNVVCKAFCSLIDKAYNLKYQIKEVTKIRGLTDVPYCYIEGVRINLPNSNMILDVTIHKNLYKSECPQQSTLIFLDQNANQFHQLTPLFMVSIESFYIKYMNNLYYIINNDKIVKTTSDPLYKNTMSPLSLQHIYKKARDSLSKMNEIDSTEIKPLLISTVIQQSQYYKLQKIRNKQILKIVQRKITQYQQQIAGIIEKASLKSKRTVKYFSTCIILQYLFVHYMIYFHLSWDIMQPITVLLANIDLFIAYYYFVFRGQSYTLNSISKGLVESNKRKWLKKEGLNLQKYEQMLQIRQYLQFEMSLYSKNPYRIMDALDQPIKLLDTR